MTTARNTTRRFGSILIDHRIILLFHILVLLIPPFVPAEGTHLRVAFRFLAWLRTGPVPYFLSWKEKGFFTPSSPIVLLLLRPRESVSYLPPKFLPDECGVAYGKDHRCQLRETGSWWLISSSDHSRMNRSLPCSRFSYGRRITKEWPMSYTTEVCFFFLYIYVYPTLVILMILSVNFIILPLLFFIITVYKNKIKRERENVIVAE